MLICSPHKNLYNNNTDSEKCFRKRKSSDTVQNLSSPAVSKRGNNAPVTRSVHILNTKRSIHKKETSLVPRLTRLSCQEDSVEGKLAHWIKIMCL